MSTTVAGLILMTFGAFCVGGAWSFRQQKLPVLVQVLMACAGVAVFVYGGYILFKYN